MKTNRRAFILILTILTVLAVFTTFSCSGLFTSPDSKPGMGKLTINLPGAGARYSGRLSDYTAEDIVEYKITGVSEKTGEIDLPTQTITGGILSVNVPVGQHSIVVIGIVEDEQGGKCLEFIGRKSNVSIQENQTTSVEMTMIPFSYRITTVEGQGPTSYRGQTSFWSGILPVMEADGYIFDGWYSDHTCTTKITYWPDTTDWENYKEPVAKFIPSGAGSGGQGGYNFPPAGTPGVYYVTQDGSGNQSGTDPDNTASFHNVFVDMNNRFTLEDCDEDGCPRIYILSDIANADMIKRKVKCIGVNISNGNGNITISGKCKNNTSEMPYTLVCNFEGIILENITIDSENARRGIDNRNTLTLNHCIIKNCAIDTSAGMSGPGIYTSANLTLKDCEITNCHNDTYDGGGIYAFSGTLSISNSSITNCSADNGGGIYIDNECKLTMTDSTISSCTASRGGGISINCSSRGTNNPVSFTNCKVTGCTGTSGQASICASTSTGYVGSNEDLTSADVWNTAISGMVFTNWNQAVTYNE